MGLDRLFQAVVALAVLASSILPVPFENKGTTIL